MWNHDYKNNPSFIHTLRVVILHSCGFWDWRTLERRNKRKQKMTGNREERRKEWKRKEEEGRKGTEEVKWKERRKIKVKGMNSNGCVLYCSECFLWLQRHFDSSAVRCCAVCLDGSMYVILKYNIKYNHFKHNMTDVFTAGLFHQVNMHLFMNIQDRIMNVFIKTLKNKTKPGDILQFRSLTVNVSHKATISANQFEFQWWHHNSTSSYIISNLLFPAHKLHSHFHKTKSNSTMQNIFPRLVLYPQCQSSGIPCITVLRWVAL